MPGTSRWVAVRWGQRLVLHTGWMSMRVVVTRVAVIALLDLPGPFVHTGFENAPGDVGVNWSWNMHRDEHLTFEFASLVAAAEAAEIAQQLGRPDRMRILKQHAV